MKLTVPFERGAMHNIYLKLNNAGIKVKHIERNGNDVIVYLEDGQDETAISGYINEALVENRLKDVDSWDTDVLRDLTKSQIENYIENNITDLASAKTFLKKQAALVLYLYKRLMQS